MPPRSRCLLLLVVAAAAATTVAFVGSSTTSTTSRRRIHPPPTGPRRPQAPLALAAAAASNVPHPQPPLAAPCPCLPTLRGGAAGGGGDTGRRSVRGAVAALVKEVATKHFLVAGMVVSILLAAADPTIGRVGGPLRPEVSVNVVGVSFIFLLSGLSLRVDQLAAAAKDLRLNAAIQGFNLGIGPLLGLLFQALLLWAKVDPRLATGLLIVSCLPTTVNMCIVLSSAARASLATAVFNAVLSNFLGVFVAPATIFLAVGAAAVNVPYLDVVKKLVYKVLFPVLLGVGLRARVPPLRQALESPKAKLPLKLTTESILISIIYTTFCQSFLTGLAVTGRDLGALALSVPAFHLLSLALMFGLARAVAPRSRGEQVAAAFTGSQKTLAFGMPLIKTIFEASPSVAHYAAPLLFIHPSQLVLGSLLVPAFARYIEGQPVAGGAGGGRRRG